LIEIVAEDRPGLLYDLATAISANGGHLEGGLTDTQAHKAIDAFYGPAARGNIGVVLIDPQAHKAIDVFYVTADGGKLAAEKQAAIRVAVEKAAGVARSEERRVGKEGRSRGS